MQEWIEYQNYKKFQDCTNIKDDDNFTKLEREYHLNDSQNNKDSPRQLYDGLSDQEWHQTNTM